MLITVRVQRVEFLPATILDFISLFSNQISTRHKCSSQPSGLMQFEMGMESTHLYFHNFMSNFVMRYNFHATGIQ